jgi:L-cystine uptake protein TcyP (sodium:dicarboxylate symporter family)
VNNKTILALSIVGVVIVSLVVGANRKKINIEAKQAEDDSMQKVRDMFKDVDFRS